MCFLHTFFYNYTEITCIYPYYTCIKAAGDENHFVFTCLTFDFLNILNLIISVVYELKEMWDICYRDKNPKTPKAIRHILFDHTTVCNLLLID